MTRPTLRSCVVVAVLLLLVPAPAALAETHGSWIVVVDSAADVHDQARAAAAHGRIDFVYDAVLGGFAFAGTQQAADALARNPRVSAVVPQSTLSLTEFAGWGIFRIDAELAMGAGRTGSGVRAVVIDSGVDTDHPDLAPNLDLAEGANCVSPGAPPEDEHGHGTHVAGVIGAAFNDDSSGLVGVANAVEIVPVKAFDATGEASTAQILCALDHVAELASDDVPTVLNMSWGESGGDSECDGFGTDVLHEAVCDVVDQGVIAVAAAGNTGTNAAGFLPAAFDEVITVSATADFDGNGGPPGSCRFTDDFAYECDNTLASFSNYGTVVDVTAPGVQILSTYPGGQQVLSGTSMAAPHVSGVVALVLEARPNATLSEVRDLLLATGECPNGSVAGAGACTGQGQWTVGGLFGNHPDSDGQAEPLVNAFRAAEAAGPPVPDEAPPSVTVTAPLDGAHIEASAVVLAADATDDRGVVAVDFAVDDVPVGSDTTAPYEITWTATADGVHTVVATARDRAGNGADAAASFTVTVPPRVLGVAELGGFSRRGASSWSTWVAVLVTDQHDAPAPGVVVRFRVSTGEAKQCTTGVDGRCASTKVVHAPEVTSVSWRVRSVAGQGTWDGARPRVTLSR
jgi:subtilisin